MDKSRYNFVPLYTWIIPEYDLSLTDAAVYSLIYSFSRDGQGCYFGSIRYIIETLNISKSTAKRSLGTLEENGLVRRWQENVKGVMVNRYSALSPDEKGSNATFDPVQNEPQVKMDRVQNDPQTGFKMNPPPVQNEPHTSYKKIIRKDIINSPSCACSAHGGELTPRDIFAEYAKEDKPLLEALTRFDAYRASRRGKVWDAQAARAVCDKLTQLADESKTTKRTEYMIASIMQSIEAGWSVLDHPKSWGGAPKLRKTVDRPEPSGNDFLKNAAHRRSLARKCG